MGATDSALKQSSDSSEDFSLCNPSSTLSQSSTYAKNGSGQLRRSMECMNSPRGDSSMRKSQICEYLGGLDINCCFCKTPASNLVSDGQKNSRQVSEGFSKSDRPLQSAEAKSIDKIMTELNGQEGQKRRIPSWEKDPLPLEDWSADEQQALIHALRSSQDLRRHPEHRQLVYTRLIRSNMPLEGRTLSECEECYEHIQANRIAYFGPIQHKRTAHNGGVPAVLPAR